LPPRQKTAWAKSRQAEQVALVIDELKDRLRPGARLEAELSKGELRIHDEGITVLDGVFVDNDEAEQTLLDWRHYLRLNAIPDVPDIEGIAKRLRYVRLTKNAAVAKQIAKLYGEVCAVETELEAAEAALNKKVGTLYGLTPAENAVILGK
jgi:hypothetical protein